MEKVSLNSSPRKLTRQNLGNGPCLAKIISQHLLHSGPESIFSNIGDGYLFNTNPLFRNIRRETIRLGFRFSMDATSSYFVFPLMSLGSVLSSGCIPYRDNFQWLQTLEAKAPGKFGLEDVRKFDLHFNYLLHESAHCIAHREFFGHESLESAEKTPATLLKIASSEAFANTVEAFSSLFVTGDIGEYFLAANTHFKLELSEISLFFSVIGKIGFESAFKAMLLGFLYSNFLFEDFSSAELGKVAALAEIPNPPENFAEFIGFSLTLSQRFRTDTAFFFLTQLGFSEHEFRIFDNDPLEVIASMGRPEFCAKIERLSAMACLGLAGEMIWS